jgi:predicted HAD superfamily Cof-like phosphohydrolase
MIDMAQDQRDFMYMGNQTTTTYNPDQIYLYSQLIEEEINELFNAIQNDEGDENILKEATDLLVVTLGYIWSHGVNPNDVWNLVHANNMNKVNETVVKDENGKIQKSEASKLAKQKMMESIRKLL